MIHFTPNGIYADTEEERQTFYDRLCMGDPVIAGKIEIWKMRQELSKNKTENPELLKRGE
jgi:hypothetical protein